jgi:hypothetical protein
MRLVVVVVVTVVGTRAYVLRICCINYACVGTILIEVYEHLSNDVIIIITITRRTTT